MVAKELGGPSSINPKLGERLSLVQVDASVETRLQNMRSVGALTKLLKLVSEAEELLNLKAVQPFEKMVSMCDSVGGVVSSSVICKKGCSACCFMAVGISSSEAKAIAKAYDIPMRFPNPLDVLNIVEKYKQCRCPFLGVDNACSIYPHRPLACRTFFNISDYQEVCDLINYPGSSVPSFDLSPLWNLSTLSAVSRGETFGDLRDFFPDGLETCQSL